MTPDERIDAALEAVLKAAGAAPLRYYMAEIHADMRAEMRKIMSDSYIAGANDCRGAMKIGDADGKK